MFPCDFGLIVIVRVIGNCCIIKELRKHKSDLRFEIGDLSDTCDPSFKMTLLVVISQKMTLREEIDFAVAIAPLLMV